MITVSAICFGSGPFWALVLFTLNYMCVLKDKLNTYAFCTLGLYVLLTNLVVLECPDYPVNVRSLNLGLLFALGFSIALLSTIYTYFGVYIIILSSFHFSEYFVTKLIKPKEANTNSFLINHSKEYTIAVIASVIEYILEAHFTPGLKTHWYISVVGLTLCVFGDVVRKLAMLTAGQNFDHMVQYSKKSGHTLVTNGIYAVCRHPAYAGWFFWCIGTQMVMCNPICFFAYIIAAWKFFNERIYNEELSLIDFFQEDYLLYKENTCSGIPFIKGFNIKQS